MSDFAGPTDLTFNRGPIADPQAFARDASAGLRSGASADEVLARAETDDAPFTESEELRAWVAQGLDELSGD